jgi:hypothetical protein
MNEANQRDRGQWCITERSLKALAETTEWQEFAHFLESTVRYEPPITPEWVYGAEGKMCHLWFTSWDSPEAMEADVSCNLGGGVPMAVIKMLVGLSGPAAAQD